MRGLVCSVLVAILLATGSQSIYAASGQDNLGFWEISLSEFKPGEMFSIKVPSGIKKQTTYYIWPFSFKNTMSLERVQKHFEKQLKNADDNRMQELLERNIAKVKAALKAGERNLNMHIALYTDTGKKYWNLPNKTVKLLAQKRLGRKVYTTTELYKGTFANNEKIDCIAIFPDIDRAADAFEIRITGLGKRIVPSYYPGHILKAGLDYDARLRKALRLFYSRPGDKANRDFAKIKLEKRKSEWLWMWANEIYPMKPEAFSLIRNVETDKGEIELKYNYRYFPYEIFNSTPDTQKIEVLKAGLAPNINWQGIRFRAVMQEDAVSANFRKSQAIAQLKAQSPGLIQGEKRHVNGEIKPGDKAPGVVIVRWGISNAKELFNYVVSTLMVDGVMPATEKDSELLKEYRTLIKKDETASKWASAIPPKENKVEALVLKYAKMENEKNGVEITKTNKDRYAKLAPFAVMVNNLAAKEIEKESSGGRISVCFTTKYNDTIDSATFMKMTEIGRPQVRKIDTTISTDNVEIGTTNTGAFGGKTDTAEETKTGDDDDDDDVNADDLW
jgi:hypothetical protein